MVTDLRRIEARVSGRVQGVGFRFFVQRGARRRGLTGYVLNEPQGGVRVEAQGPTDVVEDFLQELEKGPGLARVETVHVERLAPVPEEREFVIRFG
jgi:acylphosphatase